MKELILHLYDELRRLAEAQKKALGEGNTEEVLYLQERRQEIINRIQSIDSDSISSSPESKTGFSKLIVNRIEEILILDKEIQAIAKEEQGLVKNKLVNIQKMRTFLNTLRSNETGSSLSVDI